MAIEVRIGHLGHLSDDEAATVNGLAGGPLPASLEEAEQRSRSSLPGWLAQKVGRTVSVRRTPGEPESIRFVAVRQNDSYYDDREELNICPDCGWIGRGKDMAMGDSFDCGCEWHCPSCNHYFGFRAFPRVEEVLTDPRANPIDRMLNEIVWRKERGG